MLADEDPDFSTEEDMKLRNDKRYVWRSLRLCMGSQLATFIKYHNGGMKALAPSAAMQDEEKQK